MPTDEADDRVFSKVWDGSLPFFETSEEAPEPNLVLDLDFGHTDPQWILPLGVRARLDCSNASLTLVQSPFC